MAVGVSLGGKGGKAQLWGVPCVSPEPTMCPLQPEGEKWGENHGNRALPQAAVSGDGGHSFARAPHPVHSTPMETPAQGRVTAAPWPPCVPQCWQCPWGGLVTPLPLRAVTVGWSRAPGSGRARGTPQGQWVRVATGLVAEGTFQRWWPSCLCVWDVDLSRCVWCPGDTWVQPCRGP